MTPSPACIALTKASEGCELRAYPDPQSADGEPWTVGWGHTGPEVKRGTVWSQQQADMVLAADLKRFGAIVTVALDGHPTTQGQFDAMTDFAFNVGPGAFRGSTLLKKHLAGDYAGAAAEFGKWVKNALPGTVKRRAAEASLYRGNA